MSKKLMLIDGHSILNRAFYGLPPLTSIDGTPTGAIYGFLNIMFRFLDEEKPDYLAAAFDLSTPTFRHKMYDAYKGTRKQTDPDLKVQVPLIKELLGKMNIPIVTKEGFEADDILGTLSKENAKEDLKVTIVSGDKDLLQLVDNNITVKNPKTSRGQTIVTDYTPDKVEEEFGVNPDEFILLKAIMGDSSDNIPGVKGVGPKSATPIVAKYHTLKEVLSHIQDLTPAGLQKKMLDGEESIKLSYKLAKIDTHVPLDFTLEDAKVGDFFNPDSYELFVKYNFKNMLSRFSEEDKINDFKLPTTNIISSIKEADVIFADAKKKVENGKDISLAIDKVEATDNILAFLNGDYPSAVAININENDLYYISGGDLTGAYLQENIKKLLESVIIPNAGNIYINDIKKSAACLNYPEDDILKNVFDVSLIAYLLNPNIGDYNYSEIARLIFDTHLPSPKDLKDDPIKLLSLDAAISFKSGPILIEKLKRYDMYDLFTSIERPLIPVLISMQKVGIKVDKEALKEYGNRLEEDINKLQADIWQEAGEEFNIQSPKILASILFEKLNLPHGKKTKTGYSTAADVLEGLAKEHKIVADILEFRTLSKLKSTYAEGLYNYIEADGRIHTDFNQTVTATGRLSSTNPNLQNIPIRTAIGRQLRKVFVPEEGFTFIDADYSQIELRVLAHMSGDEKLIAAYNSAEDIHKITASQVFKVPLEEVTDLQRRNAKAVNFGIIYGMSSFGLSKDLSISTKEAKSYIDSYFETYPAIKEFLDGLVEKAKEKGYSETMFKRRRPILELKSKNFNVRSFGERIAKNAPIQGSAADIMKIAMLRTYKALKESNLESRLLLQVHDELLIECKIGEEEAVKAIIEDAMENAASLKVPLSIDINEGSDWLLAH